MVSADFQQDYEGKFPKVTENYEQRIVIKTKAMSREQELVGSLLTAHRSQHKLLCRHQ